VIVTYYAVLYLSTKAVVLFKLLSPNSERILEERFRRLFCFGTVHKRCSHRIAKNWPPPTCPQNVCTEQTLLSLTLEGVYGRAPFETQTCVFFLQYNIITVIKRSHKIIPGYKVRLSFGETLLPVGLYILWFQNFLEFWIRLSCTSVCNIRGVWNLIFSNPTPLLCFKNWLLLLVWLPITQN